MIPSTLPHGRIFPRWSFLFCGLIACALAAVLPAQEKMDGVHGAALLRGWVQPEFPAEARRQKLAGDVVVNFIVDAEGRVTTAAVAESSAALFEEPALAAVRQWTFTPALENDRPVASGMTVLIEFPLSQLKQKTVPTTPPPAPHLQPRESRTTGVKPISAPDPDYPEELEERKLPGEVRLELTITAEGTVTSPRVLWASHPAFVETSLRTAERSKFEPARQGLLAKSVVVQYPVSFRSFGARRADMLAASGLEVLGGASGALPEPFVLPDPVYPHELLLQRVEGSASVSFTLGENGFTRDLTVVDATAPEFAAALVAAVEVWTLKPGAAGGQRASQRLFVRHEFKVPTEGSLARLLASATTGQVRSAEGLDAPLRPLWRGFPVYPAQLLEERPQGTATMEFIIDRGGRARLPRVVSATRPEFGWAAAMAVSQWVFERPKRDGVPTDVRVQVPIGFKPPA